MGIDQDFEPGPATDPAVGVAVLDEMDDADEAAQDADGVGVAGGEGFDNGAGGFDVRLELADDLADGGDRGQHARVLVFEFGDVRPEGDEVGQGGDHGRGLSPLTGRAVPAVVGRRLRRPVRGKEIRDRAAEFFGNAAFLARRGGRPAAIHEFTEAQFTDAGTDGEPALSDPALDDGDLESEVVWRPTWSHSHLLLSIVIFNYVSIPYCYFSHHQVAYRLG